MAETRGGARKGAGRRPSDAPKRISVNVRLSIKAVENIQRMADRTGKSRQQIINEWAEGLG